VDEIDRANAQAELLLALQLKVRRPVLLPTGCCHNCDHGLCPPKLFCDSDCRDDWQRREARKGK